MTISTHISTSQPTNTLIAVNSNPSNIESLQRQVPSDLGTEGSARSIDCYVEHLSAPSTKPMISQELQKKVSELAKAFSFVKSDISFDDWIKSKTKFIASPSIQLKEMLINDLFSLLNRAQTNARRLKIPQREYNRHYKPTLTRLKGLFSLYIFFNNDIYTYEHEIIKSKTSGQLTQNADTIIFSVKQIQYLHHANQALEKEISKALNSNYTIKKLFDEQIRSELSLYIDFFKYLRKEHKWENLRISIRLLTECILMKKTGMTTASEKESMKATLRAFERIQDYVDSSIPALRKLERACNNPYLPSIGRSSIRREKLLCPNLDKKCSAIKPKIHAFLNQIERRSFHDFLDTYKNISSELLAIQSNLVNLMILANHGRKLFHTDDPWDYNAFVKGLPGWPYSRLPYIELKQKTFDTHLEGAVTLLDTLMVHAIIIKAHSETVLFNTAKAHKVSLEIEALFEKSLKSQLQDVKEDPKNIAMSQACPSIGERVWKAVDKNFSQFTESVKYFVTNKNRTVRSFDEYESFIHHSIAIINASFNHCDSIITNLFQHLSVEYKQAKYGGKETTSIINNLDALADDYDQLVGLIEEIHEILQGEVPEKVSIDTDLQPESIELSKKGHDASSSSISNDNSVLELLGISHLFITEQTSKPDPVTPQKNKKVASCSTTLKPKTKKPTSNTSTKTKEKESSPVSLDRWEDTFTNSLITNKWDRHLKLRKLLRLMKKDGWKFLDKSRGKGSHILADAPDGRRVTIPTSGGRGRSLKPGTFGSIRRRRRRK